jgi:hypothetical protein
VGTGVSVFLIAAGAILTFAVETESTEGINVNNVGIILMVVGALGLAIFALVWGPRSRRGVPQTTIVEERPVQPVVQERVVVQEPVATSRPVVERRVYE